MDASSSPKVPRVNNALVKGYVGKTVRVIGKFKEAQDNHVTLEASDHQDIKINTGNPGGYNGVYVEVIGTVQEDMSVTEMKVINFAQDDFDLDLYNKAITLANDKMSALFM